MNNQVFINLQEVIDAAKRAENSLWRDIQKALRSSKSPLIFNTIEDFMTTASFVDVGDNINAFIQGHTRQYERRNDMGEGDAYLESVFLSFQDNIYRALQKYNVQDKIIKSFINRPDIKNNFKSAFTGKFTDNTPVIGGTQSIINEIKEEAQRVAWTSQFPGFDFRIEPYGSLANSVDLSVTIQYTGPRGGQNSFTFFEDVKSRLDGLGMGSFNGNYIEEVYNVLTSQAKKKYADGTFIVTVKGSAIEKLAANAIASKIGRQNKNLNRRMIYTSPSGEVRLLSDLLASSDFEAKIGNYYNKQNIRKIGINLMSGYGRRK